MTDRPLAQERTEQAITSRPPDADDDPAAMRAELAACRAEILRLRELVLLLRGVAREREDQRIAFMARLLDALGTLEGIE